MPKFRCFLCRHRFSAPKELKTHISGKHSKLQIVREILKNGLRGTTVFRAKRRRRPEKTATVFLQEKLEITYNTDTIWIKNRSKASGVVKLKFGEARRCALAIAEPPKGKSRRKKRRKANKLFEIDIERVPDEAPPPRSLDERSGEFYECRCMLKTASDTDSGSEAGVIYFCNVCGCSFQTLLELARHEQLHQYYCKLCDTVYNYASPREHLEQHVLKVFVCHVCGFEFIHKEMLRAHLDFHFEQQTFENILDMEQDYNMFTFCNPSLNSGDYNGDISNILFYLTYPYDHSYSRNLFLKVSCDLCYQEFFVYEYQRHLKLAHLLR